MRNANLGSELVLPSAILLISRALPPLPKYIPAATAAPLASYLISPNIISPRPTIAVAMSFEHPPTTTSIAPLLKRLAEDHESITPAEIILVIDHIFNNQLSDVQIAAFLTALHIQRLDIRPEIIAAAAEGMRGNGVKIEGLDKIGGGRKEGSYEGGLVSSKP